MAKILFIATHGYEDPTKAGLAFFLAKGAQEEGHQPMIALAGDGSALARRAAAEAILPVGLPSFKELATFAVEKGIPVYT